MKKGDPVKLGYCDLLPPARCEYQRDSFVEVTRDGNLAREIKGCGKTCVVISFNMKTGATIINNCRYQKTLIAKIENIDVKPKRKKVV